MFAKSFIALDGNGRLAGTAPPYPRYTCHLNNDKLQYHSEYAIESPWFEHIDAGLTCRIQWCAASGFLCRVQ